MSMVSSGFEPASDLGPLHVLILEDSEGEAERVVRRLRTEGLDVYALRVDNKRDYLDALHGSPDVIISELRLPDLDGQQALELCRDLGFTTPFIVLVEASATEEAARLLDLGACDYVPMDQVDHLVDVVRRCVEESREALRASRTVSPDDRLLRGAEIDRERGYLRSLLEASVDPLVTISLEGRITDVNKAAMSMTGMSREELLGSDFPQYFTDPAQSLEVYDKVLSQGSATDIAMTIRHRDGSVTPVLCNASLYYDADGTPLGIFAAARDITTQKQAEATFSRLHAIASLGARAHRIADLEQICADAASTIVGLMPDLDSCELWRRDKEVSTQAEVLTLVAASPAVTASPALSRELVPGSMVDGALHGTGSTVQGTVLWPPAGAGVDAAGGTAVAVRAADAVWGVLVVHHRADIVLGEAAMSLLRETARIVSDAVMRADVTTSLWHEARHDSLTSLPNRAFLTEMLGHALEARGDRVVAVAILDLDDFKAVNDRYGHEIGDRLLVRVAERLSAATRPSDLVARLGGDEFAVLVTDLNAAGEMEPLVDRVLNVLSAPLLLEEATLHPRGSVGWTTTAESEPTVAGMLRGADLAMYEVKRTGKNSAVEFASSMSETILADALLGDELAAALDNGELLLHYQPLVDLRAGAICGAEALVRWAHPRRGMLPPAMFLGAASRLGLMSRISAWVVGEACRWAAGQVEEHGDTPFMVAVNLAATDLDNPELPDIVAAALEAAGLEPERLCLEITESDVVSDTVGVEQAVEGLRRLGVMMSIDDFGTGYSSLSQMKRLPASALKIDRGFVDGLGAELDDSAMVSSIISMAHAFSLDVVAEGVETIRQLELLIELNCEYAQGFLFGRPMPEGNPLPHRAVAGLLRRKKGLAVPRSEGSPATVVIADDLADDRQLLTRALTRSGFFTVVAEAHDGISAVRLAREHHPDMVVLDLDMPGSGGMKALKRLRTIQPETPVVVLTGAASESTVRATLDAGALACLIKGTMDVVPDLVEILRGAGGFVDDAPGEAAL